MAPQVALRKPWCGTELKGNRFITVSRGPIPAICDTRLKVMDTGEAVVGRVIEGYRAAGGARRIDDVGQCGLLGRDALEACHVQPEHLRGYRCRPV